MKNKTAFILQATTHNTTNIQPRIAALDGLRGFAALLIIIWHYIPNNLTAGTNNFFIYVKMITAYLWTGVDLFFVLSGFLLGGILLDNRSSNNYFKTFYTRRFYRLLPVYYITILLVFIICSLGIGANTVWSFNAAVPNYSYLLFIQNIFVGINQAFGNYWLAHTWSLALEEQFYLLLPLLIYFLKRKYLLTLLVACSISAVFFRLYIGNRYGSSNFIFCRFDALFLGVLAAIAWRNNMLRLRIIKHVQAITIIVTVMLFISLAFSLHMLHINFYVSNTWFAIMYALLILVVIAGGNFYAKLFNNKILVYIGTISYGLYLFHPIMLGLVFFLIGDIVPQLSSWFHLMLTGISFALSILVAHFSYFYFEKRFIKMGHKSNY